MKRTALTVIPRVSSVSKLVEFITRIHMVFSSHERLVSSNSLNEGRFIYYITSKNHVLFIKALSKHMNQPLRDNHFL